MSATLPDIFKIRVTGQGLNAARTELQARKHLIVVDEPPDRGGKDEAATPLETMLSSYLACLNVITNLVAGEMEIEIGRMDFRLVAHLDSRGIFGRAEVDVPFPKIEVAAIVETNATDSEISALKEAVSKRCPISVILREAGTDVQGDWTAKSQVKESVQ